MGSMGVIMHINILHVAHHLLQTFNSNKDMRKGIWVWSTLLCCSVSLPKELWVKDKHGL